MPEQPSPGQRAAGRGDDDDGPGPDGGPWLPDWDWYAGGTPLTVDEFDDLHLDARVLLDQHRQPRTINEVAIALEAAGYTPQIVRQRGYRDVFEQAAAVHKYISLYDIADRSQAGQAVSLRRTARAFASGWWQGVPWVLAFGMLFGGRVALWSSMNADPQVASVISLAFFIAALLAGATSQAFIRKGTFYFLQGNWVLVSWVLRTGTLYAGATAVLVIAVADTWYVLPHYGPRLSLLFLEFSGTIFVFLVASVPLCMLQRFTTLVLAIAAALAVNITMARVLGADASTAQRATRLCLTVLLGSLVVLAVSCWAVWRPGDRGSGRAGRVRPPETRVVLWELAPFAAYGVAFTGLVLADRLAVGTAYGHAIGLGWSYAYTPTYEGSVDLGLLNLVVLAGLGNACIQVWGWYFTRTLRAFRLADGPRLRSGLRRMWAVLLVCFTVIALAVGFLSPLILRAVLPAVVTASLRQPGGMRTLQIASLGYALVPVGTFCCQQLFTLGRIRAPLAAATCGAVAGIGVAGLVAVAGLIPLASAGLLAGAATYLAVSAWFAGRAHTRGDEAFYGAL